MRKLAPLALAILGLATAAALFVLNTTAGLRWTVDQVLAHSGAPVEIEEIHGRLLGPASLSGVTYRDPEAGTRVRIDAVTLDWRWPALLGGLLHLTHLRAAGIDYTAGPATGTPRRDTAALPPVSLPLALRIDALELDELAMTDASGSQVALIDHASLRGSLDAGGASLRDVIVDAGRYAIEAGRVHVGPGAGMPLEASLDWRAAPPDLPVFAGTLNLGGAVADTLRPVFEVTAPFTARGRGTVEALLDTPRWTLAMTLPEPVSLAGVMASLPALSVQGDIRGEGDLSRARLRPEVALSYQGMRAALSGEAEVSADAVVVSRGRLAREGAPDTVNFSGRIGLDDRLAFTVQGDWRSLQGPGDAPWTSPSGEFQAQGSRREATASVSGMVTAPGAGEASSIELDATAGNLDGAVSVTGSARLPYFAYGDMSAHGVNVDVDFQSAGDAASALAVNASELRIAGRNATGVQLELRGTLGEHTGTLKGSYDAWGIDTAVTGSYQDKEWAGRLERLTVDAPAEFGGGRWALTQPTAVAGSASRAEIEELCLEHTGTRICADGYFAGGRDWHATAGLSGLTLQQLVRNSPDALHLDGTLEASAEIGDAGDGLEGEASARIARAVVAWQTDEPVTTEYRDVVLTATLNPAELRAAVEGRLNESGVIRGELVTGDPLADDGPLRGSITARLPSLRVIQAAVPALGLRRGTARLELAVDGTRANPRLSGDGRIEDAALDIDRLGIQLSALTLDVAGGDRGRMNIEASAGSGKGSLSASGHLAWPPAGGWRGELHIEGDDAELARLPKALVDGSPDLRITADQTGGTIDGGIRITRAELTPEAGRPQVTLSEDIVVKGRDTGGGDGARNPMAWYARINIELGDQVRFNGFGVQGRLTGSIDLDAPPRQPARANGSIRIHDGQYNLYGRKLDIKQGRLVYTGGPVDNPGIDVEVAKQVRNVSVSLSLTGPLTDPELQLNSTPAMSDTDKMSYLLLGRPASQASDAQVGLLLRAAASLVPGGGRGIPGQIQSTLGLDTLEVRAESEKTEGAAVELGKYLAPDLYVSYVAGFQQAVDIFRVRYELARHWLLQAESTTRGSGGDLLFTW